MPEKKSDFAVVAYQMAAWITEVVFRSDPTRIFRPSYGHEKLRSLVEGYDEFKLSRWPRKLDLNIELWFKKG